MRYDAFISYSRDDEQAVAELQGALERLARPLLHRRAMRIFRDKTSLQVGKAWRDQVDQASDDSRSLIIVISPRSARSAPVQQEVDHWLTTRGKNYIYLVHLDGTLEWS